MSRILAQTTGAIARFAAACAAQTGNDPESSGGAPGVRSNALASSLEVRSVAHARAASTTDGQRHFVYELAFQNHGASSVTIDRIAVGSTRAHVQGWARARRSFCARAIKPG